MLLAAMPVADECTPVGLFVLNVGADYAGPWGRRQVAGGRPEPPGTTAAGARRLRLARSAPGRSIRPRPLLDHLRCCKSFTSRTCC